MATRNRSLMYLQFRNEKKSFRKEGAASGGLGSAWKKEPNVSKQKLLGENDFELRNMEEGVKSNLKVPPSWMAVLDDINYDVSRIKAKMEELSSCHKQHLLPNFASKAMDEEQTIEILTEQITKMFQQGQGRLARLKHERVSKAEEPLKKNMMSTLASQLQDLSLQFRKEQKDYLQRLKGRQQKGKTMFSIQEDTIEDDAHFEVLFTREQTQAVSSSEEAIKQREEAVKHIAKSIQELASIFKDLSVLVIEQGTILDRIDYNIEATETNVTRAIVELDKAAKHQRGYRNKLCMLLLCIGVLIMVVVVMIRGFT